MDLATFYEQFHLLADAPNGVQKLRELILQLAVQGKLVPQDPNDEPASVLLEKSKAEKARLIKEGKLKKAKPLPPIEADEMPFEVPEGWKWVRLGELTTRIGSGSTPRGGKSVYVEDGIPFLRSQNIWDDGLMLDDVALIPLSIHEKMKNTHVLPGDVLLNITGASLGRCALVPDSFAEANVSQHVSIIRAVISATRRFLHGAMRSPYVQTLVWGRQVGMAREGLSKKVLQLFEIPLPPLAEQHRIVAKVDELMALCDELETRQKQQVEVRGKANSAALDRLLNTTDADDFARHWKRICNHFDILYDNPDNVTELRKAILQLAVQGKLVPQDPTDEPASVLVEKIKSEKARLVKKGKLKKAKPLPPIEDADVPFDLPEGWEWVRLASILELARDISYGIIKLGTEPSSAGVPVLRCSNVRFRKLDLSGIRSVEASLSNEYSRTILRGGELLMNIRGTLGGCALVPRHMAGYNIAREVAVIPLTRHVLSRFVLDVISSPYFERITANSLRGIAYRGLNLGFLRRFPVPLPPLAEQHRIVAKVDELMALCDELENGLREGLDQREQLAAAMAGAMG